MRKGDKNRVLPCATVTLLLLALPCLLSSSFAKNRVGGGSRLWPLSISLSLSSTFGEYRDDHIHAGLDIRTHGRQGLPCRAVGDGSIVRMRASFHGYGKALYLKLTTGETAVYAHLSEFMPSLENYLYAKQVEAGKYEIDISVPPGMFKIREGEIISYSGRTGTSAPHLHFEVRDVRGNPVNPLSRGWKILDNIPPRIAGVTWLPLGKSSKVNGICYPHQVALKAAGAGSYSVLDTVAIAGPVGLAADIIDRTDARSGKLAPYKVELVIDGILISRIELERFNYSQAREVGLEYDLTQVRNKGKHFMLLFKRKGMTLGDRTFLNGGIISEENLACLEGSGNGARRRVHIAVVRAVDRSGNVSVASVPFNFDDAAEKSQDSYPVAERQTANGVYFFDDFASIKQEGAASWTDRNAGGWQPTAVTQVVSVNDLSGKTLDVDLETMDGVFRWHLMPVSLGEIREFQFPEGGVLIKTYAQSFFSNAIMTISQDAGMADLDAEAAGMIPLTQPVFFGPWSLAIKSKVDIGFLLGRPAVGSEAVYVWKKKDKRWDYCRSDIGDDTVTASISSPGIYRVFSDNLPPNIGSPIVTMHKMHASGPSYPEIILAIKDEGSGVDAAGSAVYLDGEKVISRWDDFLKKMFIILRKENIMGLHELSVVSRDKVGNESRVHVNIDLTSLGKDDDTEGMKRDAQ